MIAARPSSSHARATLLLALVTLAAGCERRAVAPPPAPTPAHALTPPPAPTTAHALTPPPAPAAAHAVGDHAPASPSSAHAAAPGSAVAERGDVEHILDAVAAVHGEAGPFAVAGYRMGVHALATLGSQRGAHEIVFEHHAPATVGWSCIADGAQAATAASVGHLDLSRVDAPESEVHLIARRDGRTLVYRLHPQFLATLGPISSANARALGARVAAMRDDEVFVVTPQ